jgi:hypothetical protein
MKRLQKSIAAWQFVEWTEHLTNQRGREKKAFEEPGHWCTIISVLFERYL